MFVASTTFGAWPAMSSTLSSSMRRSTRRLGSRAARITGRVGFVRLRDLLPVIGALMAEDGALFVMEPKAADTLEGNMTPLGTVYYGSSLFHCMTQSLANGGPGHGTCMGPAKTRALLTEAGFGRVEDLPIRSATNLFYTARA